VTQTGEPIRDIEEALVDAHGDERVFLTTKAPLFAADNGVSSVITVSVDITQRKELEASLWHQAHFDALTSLPNRKLLEERLNRALTRAERSERPFAVFYLDLDGFKYINDAYGHRVGDGVLEAIAARLAERIRASDTLARLGGDELIGVVEGLGTFEDTDRVASKLLSALDDPVIAAGLSFQLRASIGIAISGSDGNDPETMLANADAALYQAKSQGGNCWSYYTPELTARAQRRIHIESSLRHALDKDHEQLALAVQTVNDVVSSEVLGYEMLVRWQHPEEGWIPPNEFIPLAESTGLIAWLGRLMLEVAARWAMAGSGLAHGQRIAVNVSPREVAASDFPERCRGILRRTGLPADRLELEITENGLMEQDDATLQRLETLRQDGVTIAIDDFGTGYSSLQYIKALPADRLKIDRSFIDGIGDDPDNRAIVAATATVAAHFGLDVVAEGVERAEDAAALAELGLHRVQGYFYGRPWIAGAFTAF
jgi:diguanylate cyclase (GGDEF)-like protein